MKVKFTRDTRPGEGDVRFKAGQVVDLPDPSADRWMRRNACVTVAAKAKAKVAGGDEGGEAV